MSDFLLILLPGAMYFWILFIGQGPMQEVLQEKESRVLPRILACPVTAGQYVLSKMLRCFRAVQPGSDVVVGFERFAVRSSSGAIHSSWRWPSLPGPRQ